MDRNMISRRIILTGLGVGAATAAVPNFGIAAITGYGATPEKKTASEVYPAIR